MDVIKLIHKALSDEDIGNDPRCRCQDYPIL